jgi:hypothetical protein
VLLGPEGDLLIPARALVPLGCSVALSLNDPALVDVICSVINDVGEAIQLENLLIRY